MNEITRALDDFDKLDRFAKLKHIAISNGYWHNIEPWAVEIDRLRRALRDIATMADWHPDGATINYTINQASEALK